MKRSNFLKSLATFIAAPSLIEKVGVNKEMELVKIKRNLVSKPSGVRIDFDELKKYPLPHYECMTPQQILEQYYLTGNLFFQSQP